MQKSNKWYDTAFFYQHFEYVLCINRNFNRKYVMIKFEPVFLVYMRLNSLKIFLKREIIYSSILFAMFASNFHLKCLKNSFFFQYFSVCIWMCWNWIDTRRAKRVPFHIHYLLLIERVRFKASNSTYVHFSKWWWEQTSCTPALKHTHTHFM